MTARALAAALVLSLAASVAPAGPADAGGAPGFRVRDLGGEVVDLAKLLERGPVLLDFWATWCKPCHASLPELQAWHQRFGAAGLTVVGVSVDAPRNHNKVRPFVRRMGLDYPNLIDADGRLQQLYQVNALPTAVLIDTSGAIATVRVGYHPGRSRTLEEKIAELLGASSGAEPAPSRP